MTAAADALVLIVAGAPVVLVLRAMRSARRLPAGTQRESFYMGDTLRSFLHVVPKNLEPGSALLIVFHGGSGSPEQIRKFTDCGFEALGDSNRFAVAYPQGVGGNWNTCQKGRTNETTRRDIDDIGLVRAIVAWFAANHRIDRSCVFAVGYSNGGHMCFRLAQEATDEIAGFAAIAANRPAPADCKCSSGPVAVPMLIVNGTADPINPFLGGQLSPYGLRSLGPVLSAMETAASFAPPGAVPRRSVMASRGGRTWVERLAWSAGRRDDVVLLAIHGGGHTIPQRRYKLPILFGRTSTEIDAPLEIWRFFRELMPDRLPAVATGA